MELSLYLAGKIQKEHEPADEAYWTAVDLAALKKGAAGVNLVFLNPAERADNLSDQKSVFGRDMCQVFSSDIVLVDARDRRGLGVGAEMMWAKFNYLPVITLAPKDSHYNKDKGAILGVSIDNYVHPFVENLSDVIALSLEEMGEAILRVARGEIAVRGPEWILETMSYYQKTQMEKDEPMRTLFEKHPFLQDRLASVSAASS